MLPFVSKRLVFSIIQLLLVSLLVFFLIRLIPGDPVRLILGSESTPSPEVIEAVRQKLGLNLPLHQQFLEWFGRLLRLNLGNSLIDDYPVAEELIRRVPRTFELIIASMVLATLVGIPAGIFSAMRRNKFPDRVISSLFSLGLAVPTYVIGTLLVLVFAVQNHIFPSSGYTNASDDLAGHVQRLILPAVTLAFGLTATIGRMTRNSLLDVMNEDYVRTARAKGVTNFTVMFRHALRNALVPIITLIGIQFGTLIGGTVLVESIFNWPGLSTLLINAARQRDYTMVQGTILFVALLVILIQLAVDVLYAIVNPRLRYS